jgi:putative hydrolase of the HAD superfamily
MRLPPGERLSAPVVIAVSGRVASGKSHVARGLAAHFDAEHVEADRLRSERSGSPAPEAARGSELRRAFGPLISEEVYAELRRRTRAALASGRHVVVDACLPRQAQREGIRSLARDAGGSFLLVECRADEATTRKRLAARDAAGAPGWSALSEALAHSWEPIEGLSAIEHQLLDTTRPAEVAVAEVIARLATRRAPAQHAPDTMPDWTRAVTFDCWNTLIFEPSWQDAHARRVTALMDAAQEAGSCLSTEQAGAAFDAAWARHMHLWSEGVASGAAEVAAWALAEAGLRDPHPALEHLVQRFEEASHSHAVEALPGAGETLERLARHGVRRALVCDTGLTPGRVVRRHLAHLGLLDLLEVQIFSDEVGVPKPDPRTFMAALAPLDTAPQHALHVGDLRRTDVGGARSVGMATARIAARHDDTTPLPEADYVLDSYADLQALLELRSAS